MIAVKVFPKAKQTKVKLQKDGSLKVYVHSPPDKGKANKEAIELIARYYNIAKSQVEIKRGSNSRNKLILIKNVE